ncbi:MAG: hypothetical protein UX09_C0025G0015 [Candidatus Uhrbacteria bacterium GW2011_GWE2_45_35]|uniref:Uncharacterized protein n=2 Tax=Candidatus Uhriibacteriota TaxID=1752732 RepID=A0A0G1JG69_9BACT|nr:MAG: hypothetical protein UW63_C0028G0005 [Candidatus Uhrbacteria bacterium GW2011_GWF2_44_350]KKU07725.1 MAG: hypothetical protein UX09_C0025G0015 [Candidatus Uhrbacteria bacterium GW2011_GWE2_45_35]HBR80989.1 hypothetical protein [Candidatus Uhrbacteria bacterium]HCU31391.1 hypothetical protein [Candidatus Uhrbacteria bacterium]
MNNESLVTLTQDQIAIRRDQIVSDMEPAEVTAAALMSMGPTSARALVRGLPTERQLAIVMASCAAGELPVVDEKMETKLVALHSSRRVVADCGDLVPVIELLEPNEVAEVFYLDPSIFVLVNESELERAAMDARVDAVESDEFDAFTKAVTFSVRTPTGQIESQRVVFDPARAFAYLNSVVRNEGVLWVEETLEALGYDLLALLIDLYESHQFDIDDDLWEEFREICPEWYWESARQRCDSLETAALLDEVVEVHRTAMEKAFGLAEDRVAGIKSEAKTAARLEAELLDF